MHGVYIYCISYHDARCAAARVAVKRLAWRGNSVDIVPARSAAIDLAAARLGLWAVGTVAIAKCAACIVCSLFSLRRGSRH